MENPYNQNDQPNQPDPETGEISTGMAPWYKRTPQLSNARTTTELLGERPPVWNLRDHAGEMDGTRVAILKYNENQGMIDDEVTTYCVLACVILDEENKPVQPVIVMTGSADVMERLASLVDLINAGTPVIGRFRNAGRAWLFD